MKKKKLLTVCVLLLLVATILAACSNMNGGIYGGLKKDPDKAVVTFIVNEKLTVVPSQVVDKGDYIILPDAEGYPILGWSEDPFDLFPMPVGSKYLVKQSTILFGIFDVKDTLIVLFDCFGDIGLVLPKQSLKGGSIRLPPATVASHTFLGWSEKSAGGSLMDAGSMYAVEKNTTLYGFFEKNPPPYESVTVEFFVEGTLDPSLTKIVDAGTSIELPFVECPYENKMLEGWANDPDAIIFRPYGTNFVANTSAMLFARFGDAFTIDFDTGEGNEDFPSEKVLPGEDIILPVLPDSEDGPFMGWLTPDGDIIKGGESYTPDGSGSLEAVYAQRALIEFEILDENGNDINEDGSLIAPIETYTYSEIDLPFVVFPNTDEYLLGWHSDINGDEWKIFEPNSTYIVSGSETLKAAIKRNVTINFEVDGQIVIIRNPFTYSNTRLPACPAPVVPESHIFLGWKSVYDEKLYQEGENYFVLRAETLTAVFGKVVTITFDVEGNTEWLLPMTVYSNSPVDLPIVHWLYPQRFVGWSTTQSVDDLVILENFIAQEDITLFAIFVEQVAVWYLSPDFGTIEYMEIDKGSTVTLPTDIRLSDKTVLLGWQNQGTGETYAPGDSVVVTESTIFYALIERTITITYFYDGNIVIQKEYLSTEEFMLPTQDELGLSDRDYDIIGWKLNDSDFYAVGDTVRVDYDVYFYAVTTPKVMTAQFSVQDSLVTKLKRDVGKHESIKLPSVSVDGYLHLGWTVDGQHYSVGHSFVVTKDVTFVAVLEELVEEYEFALYSYGYVVTHFSGNATHLTIPAMHNDLPVVAIGSSVFAGKAQITSVHLSPSVIYIKYGAFEYATNLKTINLENVLSIESFAFHMCENLEIASLNSMRDITSLEAFAFASAATKAKDKTTPLILPPRLTYVPASAFAGWTNDMTINITAVNDRFGYSSTEANIVNNPHLFTFEYNDTDNTCIAVAYFGNEIAVVPEIVYKGGKKYTVVGIYEGVFDECDARVTRIVGNEQALTIIPEN